MAKFKCENINCPLLGEIITKHNFRLRISGQGDQIIDVFCEHCGNVLTYVKPDTGGKIRANYNAFTAKSNEQKKEAIRKRAQNHYKKHGDNIVERKRAEIKRNIVKKALGHEN